MRGRDSKPAGWRPAWEKQASSPVCLFLESRGFHPSDNKRGDPGSNGPTGRHLFEYAQPLMQSKDLDAEVAAETEKGAEAGEEADEIWNHRDGFIA